MSLKDLIKQKSDAQLKKEQQELAQQKQMQRKNELEKIPVEDHPLKSNAPDSKDKYFWGQLALQDEIPPEFDTLEELEKAWRLFSRSLGFTQEHQVELTEAFSTFDEQSKVDVLGQLATALDHAGKVCFMCDYVLLHGNRYKFEGDILEFWNQVAKGIFEMPDSQLKPTEQLCKKIAKRPLREADGIGGELPEGIVNYYIKTLKNCKLTYNGEEYLVIDLSNGASALMYPYRFTNDPPELFNDRCRTTELCFKHIPAGTFIMGKANDGSAHQVTLTEDFFIGVFPVTQKQWELVMGNNPSGKESGPCAPVEQVSYNDICGESRPWPANASVSAGSFLGKLRSRTGLDELDLPTEAQWEYSCRAGTTTSYSFGDILSPSQANFKDSSINKTTPVGRYPANPWGLYDMHGNVREWCRDWFDDYPREREVSVSNGAIIGSVRVIRGGSWSDSAWFCRSLDRKSGNPELERNYIGFRIVLSAVQGTDLTQNAGSIAAVINFENAHAKIVNSNSITGIEVGNDAPREKKGDNWRDDVPREKKGDNWKDDDVPREKKGDNWRDDVPREKKGDNWRNFLEDMFRDDAP